MKDVEADLVDQLIRDWKRERPDLDAAPMAVVGRILHLSRVLEARANHRIRESGVNYTDLDVLATLRRSGPPYRLTPTALRQSALVTSGAMTACLDRLESSGLVAREPEGNDRRSIAVTLTRKGVALADRLIRVRFDEAREAIGGLTTAERNALAKLLRKLGAGLRNLGA